MPITYTPITLADLTSATVAGNGVFDVLMRANKAHLEQEFALSRIKGNEYATVYLGSLQAVLQAALQFTLQKEQQNLDFQIKAKEIELAEQKIALAQAELAIATAKLANIPKEGALLEAQTAVQTQQVINLASEKLRIDAQAAQITAETLNVPKQGELLDAQKAVQAQQVLNLAVEKLSTEAKTLLTTQQKANAVIEGTVLVAQECKLRGEFDKIVAETGMIVDMRNKTAAETALLVQKKITEANQSIVSSKQADLYTAQAAAFDKDHLVKMQDLRVKAWATARTTDPDSVGMMTPF